MIYVFWSLLLIVQNAAFTVVSRARNSGSLGYHAVAAVFSNGVWYVSQVILISFVMISVKDIKHWRDAIVPGLVYIASTVTGSVFMHWFSMKYLEKGKRKVGS